jgi:hypothetical protein
MMFRPRLRIAHRLPFPLLSFLFSLLPPLTIPTYSSDFFLLPFIHSPPLPHTQLADRFPPPFGGVTQQSTTLPTPPFYQTKKKGEAFVDECKGKRESTE